MSAAVDADPKGPPNPFACHVACADVNAHDGFHPDTPVRSGGTRSHVAGAPPRYLADIVTVTKRALGWKKLACTAVAYSDCALIRMRGRDEPADDRIGSDSAGPSVIVIGPAPAVYAST